MYDSLKGKTVILSGASRGIGRSIAVALGAQGMRLALLARSKDQLLEVSRLIEKAGGEGIVLDCDVGKKVSIETAVERIYQRFGVINVLINNAGVFIEKSIAETTLEEWDHVLRVNLTAAFLFCRNVIAAMKKQGGGKIINIASTASTQGYLNQGAYCASKHGLLGLGRCMAIEGKAHNIHVYTICPGGVRTDLIKGTQLESRIEGKPMIESENIANLVVFLLKQPENIDIPEVIVRRFALE